MELLDNLLAPVPVSQTICVGIHVTVVLVLDPLSAVEPSLISGLGFVNGLQ